MSRLTHVIELRMTRSHEIPASQIPAWITPGLTDSPQAFRLSDAPTASYEQVQKSIFRLR